MRIGIVGAENSHCAHIAKSLNVRKSLPGCEVTHVWGETPEFAAKAAEEGNIPNIVDDPTDMIGHIDGAMFDLLDAEPISVTTALHGEDAVAVVTFKDGPIVSHQFLKEWWAANFTAAAYGDDGAHHTELPWDEDLYIAGIRLFTGMFESRREPFPPLAYLCPIAILQAIDLSLGTGSTVAVPPIPDL